MKKIPGPEALAAFAFVIAGLVFVTCAGGQTPGAPGQTAPTSPSPAGPNTATWLTYTNATYGVTLRYPPNYKPSAITDRPQPAPDFSVGFLQPLTHPTGMEPPFFAVDVYDNARRQSLDDWLAANGAYGTLGPVTRDSVQVGGKAAVRLAYQRLVAPSTFYYVAVGSFVYRFTPLGPDGDAMLGTVQFSS